MIIVRQKTLVSYGPIFTNAKLLLSGQTKLMASLAFLKIPFNSADKGRPLQFGSLNVDVIKSWYADPLKVGLSPVYLVQILLHTRSSTQKSSSLSTRLSSPILPACKPKASSQLTEQASNLLASFNIPTNTIASDYRLTLAKIASPHGNVL